jgi:outer membrane protein OmpA-like peptidoglycan-associated protein
MTRTESDESRSPLREWLIALFAAFAWFLLAANATQAQMNQVPDIVLAQVLGTPPPSASQSAPEPASESMAGVRLVAHQMRARFEDQLVAGVSRPCVDLEVHFDFDSDEIQSDSRPRIEAAAQVLNQSFPGIRFRVAGFADALGDAAYNQALSERRAEAVWRELVNTHGVDPDRLERFGFGEDDPSTKAENALRRRVELQILRGDARSL